MKMSDIQVGMRLKSKLAGDFGPITVTEITDKGFKYSYDREYEFIPRWGMSFAKDGHEHFGVNREALYTPLDE